MNVLGFAEGLRETLEAFPDQADKFKQMLQEVPLLRKVLNQGIVPQFQNESLLLTKLVHLTPEAKQQGQELVQILTANYEYLRQFSPNQGVYDDNDYYQNVKRLDYEKEHIHAIEKHIQQLEILKNKKLNDQEAEYVDQLILELKGDYPNLTSKEQVLNILTHRQEQLIRLYLHIVGT